VSSGERREREAREARGLRLELAGGQAGGTEQQLVAGFLYLLLSTAKEKCQNSMHYK
jgi:hypothetical protein